MKKLSTFGVLSLYLIMWKQFFTRRKNLILLFLIAFCIAVFIVSNDTDWVEQYYSRELYPYIGRTLRILFGWIPFSLGDLVYAAAALVLLYRLFRFLRTIFRREFSKRYGIKSAYAVLGTGSVIYLLFNILWGMNYAREGIASQLHLKVSAQYSTTMLDSLTRDLVLKTNAARARLGEVVVYPDDKQLFDRADSSYQKMAEILPFLQYRDRSVKVPVFNTLGAYLGYSGYYNPFTGEAQVNTVLPKFLLPFVTCHEMAHQLGYATEDEANFVGYLTAANSADPIFRYSAYLEMYRYANEELWYRDSMLAIKNYSALDTAEKKDLSYLREYLLSHENSAEEVTSYLYDKYLKANHQPQGIDTYNQVTAWLIAYRRKYGRL